MQQIINIGLVEDQFLFREGMKAILNTRPDFHVVFESADGYSVLSKLQQCDPLPNILLVDLSLPPNGKMEFSGMDVTMAIKSAYPDMKIIILSVHNNESFITQVIEKGAHGYLVKDSDPQEVCDAIYAVYARGSYINERTLKAIQNNMSGKPSTKSIFQPQNSLSKREIEILELICHQYTAEEIAEKLFISVKTVNGHRNNLLLKTGSKNTAGLVVHAMKNNLVHVL